MIALLGRSENNEEIIGVLVALHIRVLVVASKADTRSAERLVDLFGDFARLYGAQGSFLYLIRPDGHVALFQRRVEASGLAIYLKKIRGPEIVETAFGE